MDLMFTNLKKEKTKTPWVNVPFNKSLMGTLMQMLGSML